MESKLPQLFSVLAIDIMQKTYIILFVAIAVLCNGSTPDSDSVRSGSNPDTAAISSVLTGLEVL